MKDRLELLGFSPKVASRLQQRMRSAITSEIENKGFVPWAKQFDGEWDSKRQKFEFGAQSTDKYYEYIKNLAFSVGKAAGLNRPMLKRLGSFFSEKALKNKKINFFLDKRFKTCYIIYIIKIWCCDLLNRCVCLC